MTSSEILKTADKTINGDRQDQYGRPERNFHCIAALWTDYMRAAHPAGPNEPEIYFSSRDVAMCMSLLKHARVATGVGTDDSFVDACGYIALAGGKDQ